MKKIYIAGPDVFEPDSIEIGKRYSDICKRYGYEGSYPLDNMIDFDQDKKKIAGDIFFANIELIKQADIVVANLNPFRGKEPDSGTVWECGYAYGLGKKVYGYMKDASPYLSRFKKEEQIVSTEYITDSEGKVIEDFDHPVNLMIACSAIQIIGGGFEDVFIALKENYFL